MEMMVPGSNLIAPVATGTNSFVSMATVHERIVHLSAYYPAFDNWFWGLVVPGTFNGTRLVHTVIRDGRIVGVLIAKLEACERKICTVWVDDAYKGTGMGVRLIRHGCDWLGTSRPLATVPEERMPEFAAVLSRLGFELTECLDSFYRTGKKELVFNGHLTGPRH
ncbi:GNAT family N-acetyltransferase [Xanthobacter sp. V0B-10]|uniref:GNAT family N-acetyltransferase n=1 Tax=Xanthobacter albus TaxID=3119929 RepID=UPI003729D988